MNRKELEKLACEVLRLRIGVAKLAMTGNKAALVEPLYLHLQDPSSSKPEPEREDVPDTTPKSEDSSEPSREGATTESTPYIFNQFASALHWIMATNYAADLIHYLDDFLLAGPPGQPTCSESTETMLRVCERLGIPVALDKLEGPVTTITFLGITIDTTLQQLRLPPDKLQEMTLLIKSWLGKHKTTKRDLLSLIGKLSFAPKVVPSGRLFLRRLIELSTTVSKLHHHIHLNVWGEGGYHMVEQVLALMEWGTNLPRSQLEGCRGHQLIYRCFWGHWAMEHTLMGHGSAVITISAASTTENHSQAQHKLGHYSWRTWVWISNRGLSRRTYQQGHSINNCSPLVSNLHTFSHSCSAQWSRQFHNTLAYPIIFG